MVEQILKGRWHEGSMRVDRVTNLEAPTSGSTPLMLSAAWAIPGISGPLSGFDLDYGFDSTVGTSGIAKGPCPLAAPVLSTALLGTQSEHPGRPRLPHTQNAAGSGRHPGERCLLPEDGMQLWARALFLE